MSTIRFGASPRRWSAEDRLLAVALTVYESEQTKYGLPARVVYDDELGTWLTVNAETTDYAEAALAAYREQNKNIPDGTVLRVVLDKGAGEPKRTSPPEEHTLDSNAGPSRLDADTPLG